MDLKGKIVVVTGASSGIGEAIASKFGEEGAKVVLCARREGLLNDNVLKIQEKGGEAFFVKVDLTDDKQIQSSISSMMENFGRIDVWINNAGVAMGGPIDEFPMSSYDEVMNINLRGLFACTKFVVPIMKHQKSGTIINIASGSGKSNPPTQSAYAASKAGVISLSESIAGELKGHNVKVHTVSPGMVAVKGHYEDLQREKILQPEDIADTVVYLAKLPQRVNIPEVNIFPYYPIHMLKK